MSRSILITGCSSGIGYDAAVTLKARGWRVLATCRAEVDAERLREAGHESFALDYADPASVAAGAEEALTRTDGRLDALFNNGAFALPGLAEDLPRAGLEANFAANFFGPFDLTNRILPSMRKRGEGRIVQCSSVLGFCPMPYRGSYIATKYAMEGMTDAYRLELHGTGVKMILIEPGPITTRIRENSQKVFEQYVDWENAHEADRYRDVLLPRLYDNSGAPDRFELPPSAVTAKLIRALESPRPAPRYFVTTPTYISNILRRALPTRILDWVIRKGGV